VVALQHLGEAYTEARDYYNSCATPATNSPITESFSLCLELRYGALQVFDVFPRVKKDSAVAGQR